MIAEEGDDISDLEAPKEEVATSNPEASSAKDDASTTPAPSTPSDSGAKTATEQPSHHSPIKHAHPLFPSVLRLLLENNITDADKIKGTGVRGMLTKGDVLAFLGKASSPTGTYKEAKAEAATFEAKKEEPKVRIRLSCIQGHL